MVLSIRYEYKQIVVPIGKKSSTWGFGGKVSTKEQEELRVQIDMSGTGGWELVSVVPTCAYHGVTINFVLFFKRSVI